MSVAAKSGWLTKQGAGGIAGRSEFSRQEFIKQLMRAARATRTHCSLSHACSLSSCVLHVSQKTGRSDGLRLLRGSRHSPICKFLGPCPVTRAECTGTLYATAWCSAGQEDTEAKGVIALKDCVSVKNADEETGKENSFLLNAGDRTYFFVADTPGARRSLALSTVVCQGTRSRLTLTSLHCCAYRNVYQRTKWTGSTFSARQF